MAARNPNVLGRPASTANKTARVVKVTENWDMSVLSDEELCASKSILTLADRSAEGLTRLLRAASCACDCVCMSDCRAHLREDMGATPSTKLMQRLVVDDIIDVRRSCQQDEWLDGTSRGTGEKVPPHACTRAHTHPHPGGYAQVTRPGCRRPRGGAHFLTPRCSAALQGWFSIHHVQNVDVEGLATLLEAAEEPQAAAPEPAPAPWNPSKYFGKTETLFVQLSKCGYLALNIDEQLVRLPTTPRWPADRTRRRWQVGCARDLF